MAAADKKPLVVITGAATGIGLSLVQEYLQKGFSVVATARKSSQELDESGAEVVTDVDVSTAEGVANLKKALGDREVNILINNAGVFSNEKLGEFDFASFDLQFQVNAVAPIRVTEALLGNLTEGSKVVMVTSRMGSIEDNGSGAYYGYRMSKAALNAASKSLAVDLKPKGIAITLVHPGLVSTRMINFNGQVTPDESAKNIIKRVEETDLENSGTFWHANGEKLPW